MKIKPPLITKNRPAWFTPYAIRTLLLVAAISLVGGYLIYYSTPRGPWAYSDSAGYLDAGRNFADGRGLVLSRPGGRFVPLHLRPPLYSFILGMMIELGIDPIQGTRWMNIGLFSGLILTVGILTYFFSRNAWFTALLSIYLLSQPDLVINYAGMMTEPLFLTLTIVQIGWLVLYVHKQDWMTLVGMGLIFLTAALWMTRFAGVANWIVLGAGLVLFSRRAVLKRVKTFILTGVTSAAPFLAWSISVRMSGWSPGVYTFDLHDLWNRSAVLRVTFIETLWEWLPFELLPFDPAYRVMLTTLGVFFLVLAGFVFYISYRRQSAQKPLITRSLFRWGMLLTLYAALHFIIVGFSFLFVTDPKPALNERVLLPSKISLILGLAVLLYASALPLIRRTGSFLVCVLFFLPLLATGIPQTVQTVVFDHNEGRGYTSASWQDLGVVEALKKLPENVPVISNDEAAVLFFTDRAAYLIPELRDGSPLENGLSFGHRTSDAAERVFREEDAALVLFPHVYNQFNQIYGSEGEAQLKALKNGLYVYYEDRSSGIYFYARSNP
jgi:hypothetical protein